MRRAFFETFLAGLLLLCPCGAARADNPLRIVVYGDSMVSGYQLQPEEAFAAQLDHKLKEAGYFDAQVANMSNTDETAGEGLQDLPALLAQRPDMVILSLGAGDAMRGIAVDLIYRYVASVAQQLSAIQTYVVILEPGAPPSMGRDYARRLDAAFHIIPTLYRGVQLFPSSEGVASKPDLSLADGLHPNARGVEAMVNGAFPLIDAGLRWKLSMLRYRQQYRGNSQINPQDFMPKGEPPKAMH